MSSNIYQPDLMEVLQVRQQTADVKSVRLRFRDEARPQAFSFRVGQFGMFSVFGCGRVDLQHLLQFRTGPISSSSASAARAG